MSQQSKAHNKDTGKTNEKVSTSTDDSKIHVVTAQKYNKKTSDIKDNTREAKEHNAHANTRKIKRFIKDFTTTTTCPHDLKKAKEKEDILTKEHDVVEDVPMTSNMESQTSQLITGSLRANDLSCILPIPIEEVQIEIENTQNNMLENERNMEVEPLPKDIPEEGIGDQEMHETEPGNDEYTHIEIDSEEEVEKDQEQGLRNSNSESKCLNLVVKHANLNISSDLEHSQIQQIVTDHNNLSPTSFKCCEHGEVLLDITSSANMFNGVNATNVSND
ncbi:hypothetical protein HAX54_048065 [Datura stramonium]|uniref:Uncharacterized protein n=1 Tax=Datura stramonium TaxID=4076 RepID=A0ABS8RQG2_DATST|nr:hypothetical protein [Datura stramonium]